MPAPKPQQVLGHCRILEKIGEGGMGEVYRARDERLERDVAIKVLSPGTLADEAARKRFRKEALALSKLNHPNVETIFEFDTQDEIDFLVMEFIPGVTLSHKLRQGPLPENEVVRLALQLAEGLAAAHERGIVHRDLKPGNLRLAPDGRLKILDFGLAKLTAVDLGAATESFTETSAVSGTLPYMAPEQLQGAACDARSDIWAAGVVLYEMTTGELPFRGPVSTAVTDAILHAAPAAPRASRAETSPLLEQVILKCLEKNPALRYQSMQELRRDLERLATSTARAATVPASAKRRARTSRQIRAIAVLPLENLSRDPEQEYFADGMTEELITGLAKIKALKVISRTSAMRYKGSSKPLPEIARELNVDAVMEGSVLRAGDRVRITVQLIHAATDEHLWAESYQQELRNVLELQAEVARAVAREIQVKLTPQERAGLVRARPVDPRAHEAYLRGIYAFSKGTPGGFGKGIDYFKQAIGTDPTYAVAYAGLANALGFAAYWGLAEPKEAYPTAKAAALKAIELDDSIADAHNALGSVLWLWDWDVAGSKKEMARALELGPNDVTCRLYQSMRLAVVEGRTAEAIAEAQQAQELDPISPVVGMLAGWVYLFVDEYERAIATERKTLELMPDNVHCYRILGMAYAAMGNWREAVAALEKGIEICRDGASISILGYALAATGETERAKSLLRELEELATRQYVLPNAFAWIYIGLGDNDHAFEWLEKGYAERTGHMYWLYAASIYDCLRPDPRFHDLARRIGLPEHKPPRVVNQSSR